MTENPRGIHRRAFLAATAFAFPMILPRSVRGANERVVTGHIGVGNQGTGNLKAFLKNAAAVCDLDTGHLAKAVRLLSGNSLGKPAAYSDYREILDRNDIDAVVVTTPDHWHALPTIHACQAGKDVYCEKPLALTIAEGRKMVEIARLHKRVVQTGSQQRSSSNFRRACEYVRSGRLGKLETIRVGIPNVNFDGPAVPDTDPPAELDFNTWLGPAPKKPYNAKHVHYNFRFFWDYSGGQMTNFGAHHLDIAQWALDADRTGPLSAEGVATFHPKHWYEVTESCRVTYKYDQDITMIVGQGEKDIPDGITFQGTKGSIFVNRGILYSKPATILLEELKDSDVHLEVSQDHHQNFLDCVRSREKPNADIEVGHLSTRLCHLGNIAHRVGGKLKFDADREAFKDAPEADKLLGREYGTRFEMPSQV